VPVTISTLHEKRRAAVLSHDLETSATASSSIGDASDLGIGDGDVAFGGDNAGMSCEPLGDGG
jgi:hypothetical protein